MPKRTLDYDRFLSSYNVNLTWKINGIISNKTFSRKQTTEWWFWQISIYASKKNKNFTEHKKIQLLRVAEG